MRGIRELGLISACVASTSASACLIPAAQTTIFFRNLPKEIDAPIAAEVTVIKLTDAPGRAYYGGKSSFAGLARVERLLKGTIDGSTIKLIGPSRSSCNQSFHVGAAGIVIGRIADDAGEVPAFEAIAESYKQRNLREGRRP